MRADTACVSARREVAPVTRLLSLREALVLAGIDEREKDVRNDITHGVLPAARLIRIENAHLCFHWPYVVTFAAVYGNRLLDSSELRRVALEKVFFVASGCPDEEAALLYSAGCWTSFRDNWRRSLWDCEFSTAHVGIDNYIEINVGKACEEVRPRVNLYAEGLDRVEESDPVLGGAAVFKDTRISVLHIGKMADRGVSTTEILEDYESLTMGDVEFAKLYFRARPPVGRPRNGEKKDVETGTSTR